MSQKSVCFLKNKTKAIQTKKSKLLAINIQKTEQNTKHGKFPGWVHIVQWAYLSCYIEGPGVNYQPHKTNKTESCLATQEAKQRGSLE